MIIEFTGVPCSGKSDVSHELAQILRNQGFGVCEKQYELSHHQNSKTRALKKVIACFFYFIKHPKRAVGLYQLFDSKKCWMNYIYLLSHNCEKNICILEQGYLQLIGSCFDNAKPDMKRMELLFETIIPQNKTIQVFIAVSKETVLDRVKYREEKPFFAQTESIESALDYSIATSNMLHQLWCQHKGKREVVYVSNNEDNAQYKVAREIFNILKQKELL